MGSADEALSYLHPPTSTSIAYPPDFERRFQQELPLLFGERTPLTQIDVTTTKCETDLDKVRAKCEEEGKPFSIGRRVKPSKIVQVIRENLGNASKEISRYETPNPTENLELLGLFGTAKHKIPAEIISYILSKKGISDRGGDILARRLFGLGADMLLRRSMHKGRFEIDPHEKFLSYEEKNGNIDLNDYGLQAEFPRLSDGISLQDFFEFVRRNGIAYSNEEMDDRLRTLRLFMSRINSVQEQTPEFHRFRDFIHGNRTNIYLTIDHLLWLFNNPKYFDWDNEIQYERDEFGFESPKILAEKLIINNLILGYPRYFEVLRSSGMREIRMQVVARPDLISFRRNGEVHVYDWKSSHVSFTDLAQSVSVFLYKLNVATLLANHGSKLDDNSEVITYPNFAKNDRIREMYNRIRFFYFDFVGGDPYEYRITEDFDYMLDVCHFIIEMMIVYKKTLDKVSK